MSSKDSTARPKDIIHLVPLKLWEIPAHATTQETTKSIDVSESSRVVQPDLVAFIRSALDEGNAFIDQSNFSQTFSALSTKPSPPSTAHVDTFKRDIPVKKETWFARKSVHKNEKAEGTADWDEFVFGLRDDHSIHEMDFTPTLFDAHKVCDWDSELKSRASEIEGYDTMTMAIFEMCHEIPAPLGPRCFPVLVMTGNITNETDAFLAVTVPLDLDGLPASLYSSGRNTTEADTKMKKKKAVLGQYAAVEKVRLVDANVEWVMATSSDAKGNLPMFAQKIAMPGAVAKDVGFLMKWLNDRRKSNGGA